MLKCGGAGYPWPCHKAVKTMELRIYELMHVLTCQILHWFLDHQTSFIIVDEYSDTSALLHP